MSSTSLQIRPRHARLWTYLPTRQEQLYYWVDAAYTAHAEARRGHWSKHALVNAKSTKQKINTR